MKKIKLLIVIPMAIFLLASCKTGTTMSRFTKDQTAFISPIEAANTLCEAVKMNDTRKLNEILGPAGKDIVSSGNDALDAKARAEFTKKANEKLVIKKAGEIEIIEIGNDGWAFPIPIVKDNGKFFFDTLMGLEEIQNRRIGRNEICAINICGLIAEAQDEFAKMKSATKGEKEYFRKFQSTDDNLADALFSSDGKSAVKTTLSQSIFLASPECSQEDSRPLHGYFFRILDNQGPDAPGGEKTYLSEKGRMTGGFAVIAYPAIYGLTGIKSFIISKDGIVFEKDFGKNTAETASKISAYNPNETWTPVK